MHGDPRLQFVFGLFSRHIHGSGESGGSAKSTPAAVKSWFGRLASSFYMEDEAFSGLARMLWVINSSSMAGKDSELYHLYQIEGLGNKSLNLDGLSRIKGFDVRTLVVPGQLETWAELCLGYTSLFAAAAGSVPIIEMYGPNGTARNMHMLDTSPEERKKFYENRKSLLELLNFRVNEIDIPDGYFSIPEDTAIAKAIAELGGKGPYIDSEFVRHLHRNRASLNGPLREMMPNQRRLGKEHINTLMSDLRQPLREIGMDYLANKGIHNISDLIIKEKDNRIVYDEIKSRIFQLPEIKKLSDSQLSPAVEYFLGELIFMFKGMINPETAYVKPGINREEHWDRFAYSVFGGNRELTERFILLLGHLLDISPDAKFDVRKHSPFISMHHRHHRFPLGENPERYTGYAIVPNKEFVGGIPLIADSENDLRIKLSRMDAFMPDEISRLVVESAYTLINTGDKSGDSRRRLESNMNALREAANLLPEAYKRSMLSLNPSEMGKTLDSRMISWAEAQSGHSANDFLDKIEEEMPQLRIQTGKIDVEKKLQAEIRHEIVRLVPKDLGRSVELALELLQIPDERMRNSMSIYYGNAQLGPTPKPEPQVRLEVAIKCIIETYRNSSNYRLLLDKLPDLPENLIEVKNSLDSHFVDRKRLPTRIMKRTEAIEKLISRLRSMGKDGHEINPRAYFRVSMELFGKFYDLRADTDSARHELDVLYSPIFNRGKNCMDYATENMARHLLFGIGPELSDFLSEHFDSSRKHLLKIMDGLKNPKKRSPESAVQNVYPTNRINPVHEMFALESLDRQAEFLEKGYLDSSGDEYVKGMMPHELQQLSAFRNSLPGRINFYKEVHDYITGKTGVQPQYARKAKTSSLLSISPEQAAGYFSTLSGYFERQLGQDWFIAQRKRMEAIRSAA